MKLGRKGVQGGLPQSPPRRLRSPQRCYPNAMEARGGTLGVSWPLPRTYGGPGFRLLTVVTKRHPRFFRRSGRRRRHPRGSGGSVLPVNNGRWSRELAMALRRGVDLVGRCCTEHNVSYLRDTRAVECPRSLLPRTRQVPRDFRGALVWW